MFSLINDYTSNKLTMHFNGIIFYKIYSIRKKLHELKNIRSNSEMEIRP